MTKDELFEAAYSKVKEDSGSTVFGIGTGVLWPASIALGITFGIAWLTFQGILKLMPASPADKKMQQIHDKRNRIKEWNSALQQLDDAGVDTKELRKMTFD
jgi:hypothetical protein